MSLKLVSFINCRINPCNDFLFANIYKFSTFFTNFFFHQDTFNLKSFCKFRHVSGKKT